MTMDELDDDALLDMQDAPTLRPVPHSTSPQPEYIYQCPNWPSSYAREDEIFRQNGSRSHNYWTLGEETPIDTEKAAARDLIVTGELVGSID